MKFLIILSALVLSSCKPANNYPDKPVIYNAANGTIMDHIAKDIPTIVYLGEDWCPYCVHAKKIFNEYAKPLQGTIQFVIVDLGGLEKIHVGNKEVLDKLKKLRGIPQFIVTKDSKTVTYVGNGDPLMFIRKILESKPDATPPNP
jgi:thiol-disulfide isomerase/thioredoxin